MMGNVTEWVESPYSDANYGTDSDRGRLGGSYDSTGYGGILESSTRGSSAPDRERDNVGFRVASVPEPCSLGLLALGGLAVLRKRRKQ